MVVAFPPPSPQKTASAASRSTSWSRSPSWAAARKDRSSASLCSVDASKRGRSASRCWRARPKIWRQLASFLSTNLRDVLVGVVEYLAKQEHGPLDRREALEQHEERHGEGVGQVSHLLGAVA